MHDVGTNGGEFWRDRGGAVLEEVPTSGQQVLKQSMVGCLCPRRDNATLGRYDLLA